MGSIIKKWAEENNIPLVAESEHSITVNSIINDMMYRFVSKRGKFIVETEQEGMETLILSVPIEHGIDILESNGDLSTMVSQSSLEEEAIRLIVTELVTLQNE